MTASGTPPPDISGWMYIACLGVVALGAFNVWRFRTGWRMLGKYYRPGTTEYVIRIGYASIPGLVSVVALTLCLFSFPLLVKHPTTLAGYAFMFCGAVFFGGMLVAWKESRRPSRWNKTPAWLKVALANGELEL